MKLRQLFLCSLLLCVAAFFIYSCSNNENNEKIVQDSQTSKIERKTHFTNEIGVKINGEDVLTLNVGKLKSDWSKTINNGSNKFGLIDKIEIVKNSEGYFLIGKSPNSTSLIELVLENGKFYEKISNSDETSTSTAAGNGQTVTCSGCTSTGQFSASECQPVSSKLGYYCTHFSKGECVKSVTVTPSEPIISPILTSIN
jgi:hypothetical protein